MPSFSLLGSNDLRSTAKRAYSPATLLDNWYDARLDPSIHPGRQPGSRKSHGQSHGQTDGPDPIDEFNRTGRCDLTNVIQRQHKPSPLGKWKVNEPPLPHDKLGPYETIYEASYGHPYWRYKEPNVGPIFGYQDVPDRFLTTYRREFTDRIHKGHIAQESIDVSQRSDEESNDERSAITIEKDKLTPTAALGTVESKDKSLAHAPYLPIRDDIVVPQTVPNFPYTDLFFRC